MSRVFADTAFFVAFVNPRDAWHTLAMETGEHLNGTVFTTDYVLVEFGNALCASRDRHLFTEFVAFMRGELRFEIIPASPELLEAGFTLYSERPDKNWSLTDCISFALMKERNLANALTTDHHFTQAGFNVLMKP